MPDPLRFILDGDTDLTIIRRFAAPPALVFRAHTEPALVQRWMLGPPGWSMPGCEMDVRPGGNYRFDFVGPEGASFTILGDFVEVDPGRRIRQIEHMLLPDRTPDNTVETLFEPDGTGTRLTVRMSVPSAEARDAMLASGMTDGMEMAYQSLDRMIAEDRL